MWTHKAFGIYMGQRDELDTAAFEPAGRREALPGELADTPCIESFERTPRVALATMVGQALTAGRRLVRG